MTIHIRLDIRGAISNRSFNGFTKSDGSKATQAEVLEHLLNELEKGHRYLPFCECPDFDPVKGTCGNNQRAS